MLRPGRHADRDALRPSLAELPVQHPGGPARAAGRGLPAAPHPAAPQRSADPAPAPATTPSGRACAATCSWTTSPTAAPTARSTHTRGCTHRARSWPTSRTSSCVDSFTRYMHAPPLPVRGSAGGDTAGLAPVGAAAARVHQGTVHEARRSPVTRARCRRHAVRRRRVGAAVHQHPRLHQRLHRHPVPASRWRRSSRWARSRVRVGAGTGHQPAHRRPSQRLPLLPHPSRRGQHPRQPRHAVRHRCLPPLRRDCWCWWSCSGCCPAGGRATCASSDIHFYTGGPVLLSVVVGSDLKPGAAFSGADGRLSGRSGRSRRRRWRITGRSPPDVFIMLWFAKRLDGPQRRDHRGAAVGLLAVSAAPAPGCSGWSSASLVCRSRAAPATTQGSPVLAGASRWRGRRTAAGADHRRPG